MRPVVRAGIGVAVVVALAGIVVLGGGDSDDPRIGSYDGGESTEWEDRGSTGAIASARSEVEAVEAPRSGVSREVGTANRRAAGALRGVGSDVGPGLVVTGRAVDVSGRGLAGLDAGLRVAKGSAFAFLGGGEDSSVDEPPLVEGETDREGRFRLELDMAQASEIFPPTEAGAGGVAGGFISVMMANRLEVEVDGRPYATALATVQAAEQGGEVEIGDVVLELAVLVTGTVTRPDGTHVPGASIIRRQVDRSSGGALDTWSWDWGGSGDVVATTDESGRFEADDLAPGMFSLAPRSSGYLAGTPTILDLHAGEASDILDLILDPGVTVTGTVLDENGRPIAKAKVWVQAEEGQRRWRVNDEDPERAFAEPGQDETGADGLFSLAGLPSDKEVRIRARRLMRGEASVSVMPPATNVVLRLSKEDARITGRVVDEKGQPVTSGRAAAVGNGEMPFNFGIFGNGQRSSLRRGGNFDIDGLKPGTYDVVVQSDGYVDARVEDVKVDGKAHVGDVVLKRGSAVLVRVVAEDGRSVPEVKVHLDPSKEAMEGMIVMSARSGGGSSSRVEVGQRSQSETTDGDGVASFPVVAIGGYEAYVWGDGVGSPEALPITVKDGGGSTEVELTIVLLASAHGIVRDRAGTLLGQVKVEFQRAEPKGSGGAEGDFQRLFADMQRGRSDSTVTRQDGTFTVKNLQPGPYEVRVGPPPDDVGFPFGIFMRGADDDDPPAATPRLVSGQDIQVDVTAPDWGIIHGVVRSGGLPAAGARIQATRMRVREDGSLRRGWQGSGERKTDASGSYEIGGLRTGTYEVSAVAKEGGLPWTERVEVQGRRVRLDMDLAGGAIEGRVLDAVTGLGIVGAKIEVRLLDGAQEEPIPGLSMREVFGSGGSRANARADASGSYRVEGLPPGALEVRAMAASHAPDSFRVDLARDEVQGGIEFRLQQGATVRLVISGYPPDIEARVMVELKPDKDGRSTDSRWPEKDGTLKWSNVAPGDYTIRFQRPGGEPFERKVSLSPGSDVTAETGWLAD